MADFVVPRIDDKVELNGLVQRVVGVTTWDDCEDDGEDITVLTITLVKGKGLVGIPESIIDAFRKENNEA